MLTPGEWWVLHWIRHGLTRRRVAAHLQVTEHAVRYHVRNIRAKLDVPDQPALRHWTGHPAESALTKSLEGRMSGQAQGITGVGQISLFIRDTKRATTFFADVLRLRHLYSFGDLVFFDCAGTRLYLHRVTDEQWRPGSIVYFSVVDIETRHRELVKRGATFTGAPHLVHRHDSGVEEWMAIFDDTEGNTLALMEQIRPTG